MILSSPNKQCMFNLIPSFQYVSKLPCYAPVCRQNISKDDDRIVGAENMYTKICIHKQYIYILKKIAEDVSSFLTYIFNWSLFESLVPRFQVGSCNSTAQEERSDSDDLNNIRSIFKSSHMSQRNQKLLVKQSINGHYHSPETVMQLN